MSSVAIYSSRSRAAHRTEKVRDSINRASAYILMDSERRPRDASLTSVASPRSAMSSSSWRRDPSLTRGPSVASSSTTWHHPSAALMTSTGNFILDNGLGSETAKFGRQNAIKEIHANFMKGLKETTNRISGGGLSDLEATTQVMEQTASKSKVIARLEGMDEEVYKRHCMSEMFMDTSKFSTRTLSALHNLEGAADLRNKKKDEYQWRKDMEQFEKMSKTSKGPAAQQRTKTTRGLDHPMQNSICPKEPSSGEAVSLSNKYPLIRSKADLAKARNAQQVEKGFPEKAAQATQRPQIRSIQETEKAPREKVSREKKVPSEGGEEVKAEKGVVEASASKQLLDQEDEVSVVDEDTKVAREFARKARQRAEEEASLAADEASKGAKEAKNKDGAAGPEDDEDGTKRMKLDFESKMSSLEAEMEAGRSKLAKLRERIRRAKGVVKEIDKALEDSSKQSG